jgi:hypothetical protein
LLGPAQQLLGAAQEAILCVMGVRLVPAVIESLFYYFDIDPKFYNLFLGNKIDEPLGLARKGVTGLCFFGLASGFTFSFFTTSATLISIDVGEASIVFGVGALAYSGILLLAIFSTRVRGMAASPTRRQKLILLVLTLPVLLLLAALPYA